MASSTTFCSIEGATTLMAAISVIAPSAPSSSSFHAACRVSRRAWSMATRASATRSRLPPRLSSGLPKAVRLHAAIDHQLERALGRADAAHAVVNAARPQAALGDLEAAPRPGDEAVDGQRARR